MGGHVFKLPEEANNRTQFTNTMNKLKEIAQTTYVDSYEEISSLFADPIDEPTAQRPAPLDEKATSDNIVIRNEELKLYARVAKNLKKNLTAIHTII